jgi:four helix bundle protein
MRDHRKLEAWIAARDLVDEIVFASSRHWKPWAGALFGQVQRSSLSVQLNIAEGSSFGPSPTYTRHLGIAYGSAVETGEILETMGRTGVLPIDLAEALTAKSRLSQRLLVGMLKIHRPFPRKR